mgnify:CR=1 FL=1
MLCILNILTEIILVGNIRWEIISIRSLFIGSDSFG